MLLMKNRALKWLGLQPSLKASCTELISIVQVSAAVTSVLPTLTRSAHAKNPELEISILSLSTHALPSGAVPKQRDEGASVMNKCSEISL